MTRIVDWATGRARTIFAFVLLSLAVGAYAYVNLPKEGEPDIDVPALFVSVPFPGISADDAEALLVKPLEAEVRGIEGLRTLSATAGEGFAGLVLLFEYGWDRADVLAEVRDRVTRAQARFPQGAEQFTISELNFSEFPIIVVALSGNLPERSLLRAARDLQTEIEGLTSILEAGLTGNRDEMIEILIDPLKLESYDVTANDLMTVVARNNQLIAAGDLEGPAGAFAVRVPSAFRTPEDIFNLPVQVDGDSIVVLGDIAEIRLTFEDAAGIGRFNGEPTVALQVVKRKGFNVIDTVAEVKARVAEVQAEWPPELRDAIRIDYTQDNSVEVARMVAQLEGAVLTAICLVMIVVLAALGPRSALLVGFAVPTSFMLCFALLALFDIPISNIVMFGLILAVGMLVDGAIVVVEYADKRIQAGQGPMRAYAEASKRMFWPIVASTATTLCAFMPMLFWPGIAGQFMGNLPKTLIFVLSASLVVALVYLPVIGGLAGRFSRTLDHAALSLAAGAPVWLRAGLIGLGGLLVLGGLGALVRNEVILGFVVFTAGCVVLAVAGGSLRRRAPPPVEAATYRRSPFGRFVAFMTGNPVMPFVGLGLVAAFVGAVFVTFAQNNNGVEFFVETEPERAIAYVRARGNLSLDEKDALVREAESAIADIEGVRAVFAFAGEGGLRQFGRSAPRDAAGQVQIELEPWGTRRPGNEILAEIEARLATIPGVVTEISRATQGPSQGKPLQLRLSGANWDELRATTERMRAAFDADPRLADVDDTLPLPGIDWQIDVDVARAGRFGADVATVGTMVQLVTRGITLDTMRVETSDEEIDIRARLPEADRTLASLDTMRVRTNQGLVPLSAFVTRQPVASLAQIDRTQGERYFDVRADVPPGGNANAEIERISAWLAAEADLPASIAWEWTGDREDQEESQAFLVLAFAIALGLMFVILLALFNSLYNSILVLTAVVLSITGVLIGMLVMGQTFSVIMTGTGIVALAGIVVNNNIVLIDQYQEFARYMPRLEAIVRTAEARIRPVLLTTITTMAGLMPMVFGVSVDFANGGYTVGAPAALWWTQLATAIVFGLGLATVLTLVVTPALLALRVWAEKGVYSSVEALRARLAGQEAAVARDRALRREAATRPPADVDWFEPAPALRPLPEAPPRAAE
jgi:multidrug efflux pump